MARLRSNFQRGSLSANATSGDTTLTDSPGFSTLPVVASPDYLMLVLDPDAVHGNPEIVKVTAHTSSATTVTVVRAQEGTSARSHNSSTTWRHVTTKTDWDLARTLVTPEEFGAVGDGVVTDTSALSDALSYLASNPGTTLKLRNTYKSGALTLTSATNVKIEGPGKIIWTGTGSVGAYIGLKFAGSCTHIEVSGLRFVGDGVISNNHAGIFFDAAATGEDFQIHHCYCDTLVLGIQIQNNSSPSIGQVNRWSIHHNYLTNIIGTASGNGYGIVNSGGCYGTIHDNQVISGNRHDIYQSAGQHVDIHDNFTKDHRIDVHDGSFLPSISIQRSQFVNCHDNTIENAYDAAMGVASDTGSGQSAQSISIHSNKFLWNGGMVANTDGIRIGDDVNPSGYQVVQDIEFINNRFYVNGGAANALVRHRWGTRCTYRGNKLFALGVTNELDFIEIYCNGETAGTATYSANLIVEDNVTSGSGSPIVPVVLSSTFCTSAVDVLFKNNKNFPGGNSFSSGTTITNPNITIAGQDGYSGFTQGAALIADEFRGLRIKGDAFSYTDLLIIENTHTGGHVWRIGEQYSAGKLSFRDITDGSAPEVIRLDAAPADGNVGLLVYRNVGGTKTVQQVSMGAADSGGTGFKVLRVPN